jgi:orotidine-5'-phosphate decarboxylase
VAWRGCHAGSVAIVLAAACRIMCPVNDTSTTGHNHPADRLLQAVERCAAPVCVGLDPVLERLPKAVRSAVDLPESHVQSIKQFSMDVLDAIAPHVPVVKFQSACYERFGAAGIEALHHSMAKAADLGLQIILDAKRGDIGLTVEHYAASSRLSGADWTTVSPYLGFNPLRPFLDGGQGAFVLIRTSNPDSDSVQSLTLADGRTVAESMADQLAEAGSADLGTTGYSNLGAVVGATKGADHVALRARMPQQLFLVPGYGAQGAGLDDVLKCFNTDGRGAIVTSSRGVIYAAETDDRNWASAVADAAAAFADELGRAAGLRS